MNKEKMIQAVRNKAVEVFFHAGYERFVPLDDVEKIINSQYQDDKPMEAEICKRCDLVEMWDGMKIYFIDIYQEILNPKPKITVFRDHLIPITEDQIKDGGYESQPGGDGLSGRAGKVYKNAQPESKVIPGVLFSDGEFVPIEDDSIMQWIAEQLPGEKE